MSFVVGAQLNVFTLLKIHRFFIIEYNFLNFKVFDLNSQGLIPNFPVFKTLNFPGFQGFQGSARTLSAHYCDGSQP